MTTRNRSPMFGADAGPLARKLNRLSRSIPEMTDIGVRLGSRVALPRKPREPRQIGQFWAVVQSSTPLGGNKWEYQIAEVVKLAAGMTPPTIRPNGRAGKAWNALEVINSPEGVQGNGVNVDDLPTGFTIAPAPAGIPVIVAQWRRDDTTCPFEFWFQYANGVTGACPP